ncbi:8700_t:CDS:2 [Dentiscutata erythropus]|uniref:8700_t:CDS:1 n=1 Tax=Dentiscutata erythropus TaxID=1348616 RepID=A0A9N9F644_9GLOM|nr:8700_t:CDS:2 [Dentiscutata erythropus]
MVSMSLQLWQNPAFPDVLILQEITEEILVNFRKCRELQNKVSNKKLDRLETVFNKLTERRAMESLRMSEYLADVVKYLQLLTKKNVNTNVIKQTLELLLKTANVQKERSSELLNDYISFYNDLNNGNRISIPAIIICCMLILFIGITYNTYLYADLGYSIALQNNKFADEKNISFYAEFCRPINQDKEKCSNRTLGDTKEPFFNFSANDGYKICEYFLEGDSGLKDSSEHLPEESFVSENKKAKLQKSFSNVYSYGKEKLQHLISNINDKSSVDELNCARKNYYILQHNETFYEICEGLLMNLKDRDPSSFNSRNKKESGNNAISICDRWLISKTMDQVKDVLYYPLLLLSCLVIALIAITSFIIKEMINWIFQQDDFDQAPTSEFIQHIKDKFPGIKDNIAILDEFWNTQIITINDQISNIESLNTDKIKLPHHLVDSIVSLWDEESIRCKNSYYKLTESVAYTSMLE